MQSRKFEIRAPAPARDRRPAPTPTNDDMGCSGSKHETATILQESDVEISSSNVMHEGGERKLSTHAGVSAVLGADEYDTIRVHVVNPSAPVADARALPFSDEQIQLDQDDDQLPQRTNLGAQQRAPRLVRCGSWSATPQPMQRPAHSTPVGATGSLSGGGNGGRFGPDEPSPASAVPAIPDQISTPMDEWDDEQLYAWVREELKSDGLHEEEVEHVLAVLRHNKIDSSVLVLLDETDLKDLGIRKQVALSLVAALAAKDARIAELEAASMHMH